MHKPRQQNAGEDRKRAGQMPKHSKNWGEGLWGELKAATGGRSRGRVRWGGGEGMGGRIAWQMEKFSGSGTHGSLDDMGTTRSIAPQNRHCIRKREDPPSRFLFTRRKQNGDAPLPPVHRNRDNEPNRPFTPPRDEKQCVSGPPSPDGHITSRTKVDRIPQPP